MLHIPKVVQRRKFLPAAARNRARAYAPPQEARPCMCTAAESAPVHRGRYASPQVPAGPGANLRVCIPRVMHRRKKRAPACAPSQEARPCMCSGAKSAYVHQGRHAMPQVSVACGRNLRPCIPGAMQPRGKCARACAPPRKARPCIAGAMHRRKFQPAPARIFGFASRGRCNPAKSTLVHPGRSAPPQEARPCMYTAARSAPLHRRLPCTAARSAPVRAPRPLTPRRPVPARGRPGCR